MNSIKVIINSTIQLFLVGTGGKQLNYNSLISSPIPIPSISMLHTIILKGWEWV